ncbi:universal stress protein [Nitrosopumilus sp. Nsub]
MIIGSHGLTGLTKIQALGSIARAISEIAPCPILLVREKN